MALFQDTRELSRQAEHVGMDKVDGWRKTALAVAGYKDTGEKNLLGKIGIMGGSNRLAAKALASGTDTGKVLKETDDEFVSTMLARGKLGLEIGKTALAFGAGGGGASIGKEATSGISSNASNLLESGLKDQSIEAAQDSITKRTDELIGNKTASELLNSFKEQEDDDDEDGILNPDGGEDLLNKAGTNTYNDDLTKEDNLKKKEGGMKNVLGKVPVIGGMASAAIGYNATARGENKEATRLAEKFMNKKTTDHEFNLL